MQIRQAGNIDYLCEIISTAKPQIDAGRGKGIAMLTKEARKRCRNLPTAIEQGTDIQAYTWNALLPAEGHARRSSRSCTMPTN